MRSTRSDDLSTRARIRDAAIALFGQRGFAETSVRTIAQRAGVSAALVIHHFGSKDELRSDCDDFVVDSFLSEKDELTGEHPSNAMQSWLSDVDQFGPYIDYLARMLTDSSAAGDHLFDALLSATARMLDKQKQLGIVRQSTDPEVTALYVTLYGIVPLVLRQHVARALGGPALDAAVLRRSTLPILDLYTNGLYTDSRILDAARDALERTAGPSSDKGENDPNQDPDPPR